MIFETSEDIVRILYSYLHFVDSSRMRRVCSLWNTSWKPLNDENCMIDLNFETDEYLLQHTNKRHGKALYNSIVIHIAPVLNSFVSQKFLRMNTKRYTTMFQLTSNLKYLKLSDLSSDIAPQVLMQCSTNLLRLYELEIEGVYVNDLMNLLLGQHSNMKKTLKILKIRKVPILSAAIIEDHYNSILDNAVTTLVIDSCRNFSAAFTGRYHGVQQHNMITAFMQLQHLEVTGCKTALIGDIFREVKNEVKQQLTYLSINDSPTITEISWDQCINLKYFSAFNCFGLDSTLICNFLDKCIHMEYLNLSHTLIENIDFLPKMIKLHTLNIETTQVTYLPDYTVLYLPNLTDLDMSDNVMVNINVVNYYVSFPNLKRLILDQSEFSVSNSFFKFHHLECLSLRSTELLLNTSLLSHWNKNFNQLKYLSMELDFQSIESIDQIKHALPSLCDESIEFFEKKLQRSKMNKRKKSPSLNNQQVKKMKLK
jgi:hypothetical protein